MTWRGGPQALRVEWESRWASTTQEGIFCTTIAEGPISVQPNEPLLPLLGRAWSSLLPSYQAVLTSSLPAAAYSIAQLTSSSTTRSAPAPSPWAPPSHAPNYPQILGQPSRLLSPLCELAIPSMATTTWGTTYSWLPVASASTCPWKPHRCQWLLRLG